MSGQGKTYCEHCCQLIKFDGSEWSTTEWPKGLQYCMTLSHPKHIPANREV